MVVFASCLFLDNKKLTTTVYKLYIAFLRKMRYHVTDPHE
jgi:hypothetical protein